MFLLWSSWLFLTSWRNMSLGIPVVVWYILFLFSISWQSSGQEEGRLVIPELTICLLQYHQVLDNCCPLSCLLNTHCVTWPSCLAYPWWCENLPRSVLPTVCLPCTFPRTLGPHLLLVLVFGFLCVHLVALVEAECHAEFMCGKTREARTCHLFLLGSQPLRWLGRTWAMRSCDFVLLWHDLRNCNSLVNSANGQLILCQL